MIRFKEAAKKYKEAERALVAAMKESFPVGSLVEWSHGAWTRLGLVERHSEYRPELFIRTHRTLQRIDAHRVEKVRRP
jgi:hypothetical protein